MSTIEDARHQVSAELVDDLVSNELRDRILAPGSTPEHATLKEAGVLPLTIDLAMVLIAERLDLLLALGGQHNEAMKERNELIKEQNRIFAAIAKRIGADL